MAKKRRTYTREFKVEAVKLVTEKGYSVAEAARSLGIGQTLLRSWRLALESVGRSNEQHYRIARCELVADQVLDLLEVTVKFFLHNHVELAIG